jgi:hypothetical protein
VSELGELVDRLSALGDPSKRQLWGVIDTVHTGPPSTLDVRISGSTVVTPGLRYRDNIYTPTAGQVVEVVREGRDLVVVGRLASAVPTAPTGATGPPGPAASPYEYTQTVAATTWTINHTLGYRPAMVSVWDTSNVMVEGDVSAPTTSQVVITFSTAFAGKARLL